MDQIEYGDKLIKLGKMIKRPTAKMKDIMELAFDLGLIIAFRIEPDPNRSIDMEVNIEAGSKAATQAQES